MDRGALWATVHGVTRESDMTEQLNNNKKLYLLQYSFCSTFWGFFFCFFFFSCKSCGILATHPGISNLHPLHQKGEVLTTGLPGKSHDE